MAVQWLTKNKLFSEATKALFPVSSVLDIGCGIYPQELILSKVHICCEPYSEYIKYLQEHLKYDSKYVFIQATWKEAVSILPPKSVDTIFLLDVIEHVPKSIAKKLLIQTEKIAKKQIVIFTPLGFIPQFHTNDIDVWGMKGGKWQEHKSGWLPKDFSSSWDVFACKNFHSTYYKGLVRKKTYGAFWAIKTFSKTMSSPSFSKRISIYLLGIFPKQHPFILFLRRIKHVSSLLSKKKH